MEQPFVSLLMGSDRDSPIVLEAVKVLKSLGVAFEVKVTSAHRSPLQTVRSVQELEQKGCEVFVCFAGLAAHLAGAVASNTIKPVIGVPIDVGALKGLDALLSTVQMPSGVPVACMAIGKPGAVNAAFLSAQILALNDEILAQKLLQVRKAKEKELSIKEAQVQKIVESEVL